MENIRGPVEFAIRKFEAIKQNISLNQDFYFSSTEQGYA